MSFSDTVKNNVVIWLLGTLAAGFGAGWGAYDSVLRVSQKEVIPRETLERLRANSETVSQDWLRITGIDINEIFDIERYRVVIRVDGVPFSYPGHAVWKRNDPKAPKQDFPLRIDAGDHEVELELFYLTQDGANGHAVGPQAQPIPSVPFEGTSQVFDLSDGTRAGQPLATIHYEIRRR